MSNSYRRWTGTTALAASTVLMSACQPVASSLEVGLPNTAAAGPVYHLPVKTMSISVGVDARGLFVAVHDVRVEGDPAATYALTYVPDSSSADKLEFSIDNQTGLLTAVKVEADSKIADAIRNAGKSAGTIFGAFEGSISGGPRIFATRQLTYWPTFETTEAEANAQLAVVNREINETVEAVVRTYGCRLKDESVVPAARRPEICDQAGNVKPGSVPLVTIAIDYAPFRGRRDPRGCAIGICTRVQSMAQVKLSANGISTSGRVALPNGSAPVAAPLGRTAFAKATTEYTLSDGLVTRVAYDKGAELPAITALPGELVGSVVGGFVDGVAQAGKLRKAKEDAAASRAGSAQSGADDGDGKAAGGTDGQHESAPSAPADTVPESSTIAMIYPLPIVAPAGAAVQVHNDGAAGSAKPGAKPGKANPDPDPLLGNSTKPGGGR